MDLGYANEACISTCNLPREEARLVRGWNGIRIPADHLQGRQRQQKCLLLLMGDQPMQCPAFWSFWWVSAMLGHYIGDLPSRGSRGGARAVGEFSKICKNFGNCKKCIILAYFSKKKFKSRVNFSRVWTKNTNCSEILRKFWKFWRKFSKKFEYFTISENC